MKPQAYTEFQPLEEVLVGRSYNKKYIESLDVPFSDTTKRLMIDLLDETEEDYQNLTNTLESLDVKVIRPEEDVYLNNKKETFPYLMNPRDDQIVVDNKIIFGRPTDIQGRVVHNILEKYKKSFLPDPRFRDINCASIVRLGEDIIVDTHPDGNNKSIPLYLKKYFEPLGYNIIDTETHDFRFKNRVAHSDAVFSILKPGVILHAKYDSQYYAEKIFTNWDFCKVAPEQEAFAKYNFWKNQIKGPFVRSYSYSFEDEKYDDKKWNQFLSSWFKDWVGYSSETHFEVNCLVVNEDTVIFSSYNKEVFKFCEKHKINPIICPFRHRFFWDGGIHCITLDLKRKGSREKYL